MSVETNNRLLESEPPLASLQEITSERNARLAEDSAQIAMTESAAMTDLSRALKQKSADAVAQIDYTQSRNRITARISQIVDYIFYLIYGLISAQFMLELIGARADNQIVQLITALTLPLLLPFKHIVATPAAGAYQLQISYLLALVFYLLLHLAINGIFRLIANRKAII